MSSINIISHHIRLKAHTSTVLTCVITACWITGSQELVIRVHSYLWLHSLVRERWRCHLWRLHRSEYILWVLNISTKLSLVILHLLEATLGLLLLLRRSHSIITWSLRLIHWWERRRCLHHLSMVATIKLVIVRWLVHVALIHTTLVHHVMSDLRLACSNWINRGSSVTIHG